MYLAFLRFFLFLLHPFFVSMTEVDYIPKDKTVEVSVRIFTDDLESTIKNLHKDYPLDIIHPKDPKLVNGWIDQYIHSRLQVRIDNVVRPMQFVGYEQQGESVWCYFEIKNVPEPKQIHVFNTLLYDYKKEQINMVRFKNGNAEKSSKLQFPDNTVDFNF
ncbi:MAG: hypothetical protein QM610_10675 [Chitinophagaceae bacterium]